VILASVPESEGKPAAESKARAAKQKGLPQCGVLLSTNYEGLTPSLWVVFSGVYDTKSQADAHVSSAKQAGYSSAYVRQIVPK
jgi:cell division septation protein DedD